MKQRVVSILGSTGSIGRSTLDVISRHRKEFEVRALAAYNNVDLLTEQIEQFGPKYACLVDSERLDELARKVEGHSIELLSGEDGLVELARLRGVHTVVNAVVGAAGLRASLAAVEEERYLALANKESLVTGGTLFPPLMEKSGAVLLPIDSEHSAVWQALNCGRKEEVRRIILTASGGPFRTWNRDQLASVTVEKALQHPTWNMGAKITIDSATLANKALEVIEAVQLFQIPASQVEVVVHPQSVVHSMVEFVDSSVIAQLSNPDMRLPISYALFWPQRMESEFGRIDWSQMPELTFEAPDFERFPMLKLGFDVAEAGATAPAVFNAANEVAVNAFLERQITYLDISDIVSATLNAIEPVSRPALDDILEADKQAREFAGQLAQKVPS
jgi:1-deoxy-D-xylulose-5-phosphate reductoisomerase